MPKQVEKSNAQMLCTELNRLRKTIKEMVIGFENLGNDHMARIDARQWAAFYRKRAKKLGIVVPVPKGAQSRRFTQPKKRKVRRQKVDPHPYAAV